MCLWICAKLIMEGFLKFSNHINRRRCRVILTFQPLCYFKRDSFINEQQTVLNPGLGYEDLVMSVWCRVFLLNGAISLDSLYIEIIKEERGFQ